MERRTPGRPRDPHIDLRVLEVTRHHLAEHGYAAMSVVAIARDAGTTRPTIYRRWSTKADLATAAIGELSSSTAPDPTDDPFADLVAELEAFRRGVSRPDGMSMVGTMLVASTDPELVALYRERVVMPRRRRIRTILERGRDAGELEQDADLDVVVTTLTGSWYANALAGAPPPRRWAQRVAAAGWTAAGGRLRRPHPARSGPRRGWAAGAGSGSSPGRPPSRSA